MLSSPSLGLKWQPQIVGGMGQLFLHPTAIVRQLRPRDAASSQTLRKHVYMYERHARIVSMSVSLFCLPKKLRVCGRRLSAWSYTLPRARRADSSVYECRGEETLQFVRHAQRHIASHRRKLMEVTAVATIIIALVPDVAVIALQRNRWPNLLDRYMFICRSWDKPPNMDSERDLTKKLQ